MRLPKINAAVVERAGGSEKPCDGSPISALKICAVDSRTSEGFRAYRNAEIAARWSPIIKAANIKPE